jgi:hypothetical protein
VDIHTEKFSSRLEFQSLNLMGGYPHRKSYNSIRMPMTLLSESISHQKNSPVDWNANDLTFWVDIHRENDSSRLECQWLNFLGGYPPRKSFKSIKLPIT